MPIYEFFCKDCNILFDFFSPGVNTEKIPDCPKCGKLLEKQLSAFFIIGRARETSEVGGADFDEFKMERALGALAREAETMKEEDPRQMANLMRKFSEKSGVHLGEGMEEALCRLASGDDPEIIEQEMGDMLEKDDLFGAMAKKGKKGLCQAAPEKDDTLYVL